MDRQSLTVSGRTALQADLAQCRTHDERIRHFQKYIREDAERVRGEYAAGGLSSLTEFTSRAEEKIEFLLKEAFWWVFEETTVVCCATPEQTNLKKDAALFWRLSPVSASPAPGTALEIFILFCEALTEQDAQFLTRFYVEFAESFEKMLCPAEDFQKGGEGSFKVQITIEPAFDFKRKYFKAKQTGFSGRMAWLKLKPVAGASSVMKEVEEARRAFVFSKEPIRFAEAALERVRQQQGSVGRPDVRLGSGGLLDIEYLTAVLQLAYGRELSGDIQSPETMAALYGLWQAGILGEKHYQDLRAAFVFLTGLAALLEHGRGIGQNAELPELNSDEFLQIARQMGYRGPDSHARSEFRLAVQHHMSGADRLYTNTMVNLANQPWDEIPNNVVVSQDSVRVRLDDLLRGMPRPEDVPALRRMGFTEIEHLGRRFQSLCPVMTAFEPFSRVIEKSWALWPEIPNPDLALDHLKRFAETNEDPYRFWYALAKSDKGLRLLLHIFGTSRVLTDLWIQNRECWSWVEQTQYLNAAQTLDLIHQPDFPLETLEDLNRFKDRETLRLALTDLFMGAPFDSLMEAHSRLSAFALERMAFFLPEAGRAVLLGLGGTGAGAAPLGMEWNFMAAVPDETALASGREWLEKITGGSGGRVWAKLGAVHETEEPLFLLTLSALTHRFRAVETLEGASPWLQMIRLAGSAPLSRSVSEAMKACWRSAAWLEKPALEQLLADRRKTQSYLESRHEEDRHLVLMQGGLRDLEWVVTAAWSRRARENFQPCGLLEMLAVSEESSILPSGDAALLREAFLEYQKIRTRLGFAFSGPSALLPAEEEDFRVAAKAAGFRDQGIHPAEIFLKQHLLRLRQNVRGVFDRFFQQAGN